MTASHTRSWLRLGGLSRRVGLAACAGLLGAAIAPVLNVAPAVAAPLASSFTQVFQDDFSGTTVNKSEWSVFNNVSSAVAHSAKNVVVHDGMVTLKTAYDPTLGKFTTGGMCACSDASMYQTYGEWDIRARATAGDSKALALLWPSVGWPPEIDFLEMGAQADQGTRQMNTQTLHYGADNSMIHSNQRADFTQWHTVGVQWGPGYIRYLLDGAVTSTIASTVVPNQPMRLGLFTSPAVGTTITQPVTYDIDWVKQYAFTGGAGTAPAAPTAVVATPGDTSASVSWTAPTETGNSLLTSYTVTAQPGGHTVTVPRSGNNDPKTTATFTGLTPGVSYSFGVSASNVFGTSLGSAVTPQVAVTGTPPTITAAPKASFAKYSTFGSTPTSSDAAVTVGWTSAAGSTAVCHQQVSRRSATGVATPLKAVSATATSVADRIPAAGSPVTYAVQATGCNGLSTAAVPGPTYNYVASQQDATGVGYSGTWSTVKCDTCSGGSMAETRTAGASVSFPVTNAYGAALVVRTGPQQSPFKIYVDGAYVGQYTEGSTTNQSRVLAFTTSWATPGSHIVKVVDVGASTRPNLDVDALLSLTK